ncbi:MAG: hypothetical protein E6Q97_12320 [Desulfurellales bacterium]|nr:MAG: hypothetical protein E6Q97_12320 [Desulfurellales bacterium]
MAQATKITLNVTNENVEEVQRIARELETTRTQVINDSIALAGFLYAQRKRGATVMVRDRWGNYREVTWGFVGADA